jgi:hypothetical protein
MALNQSLAQPEVFFHDTRPDRTFRSFDALHAYYCDVLSVSDFNEGVVTMTASEAKAEGFLTDEDYIAHAIAQDAMTCNPRFAEANS